MARAATCHPDAVRTPGRQPWTQTPNQHTRSCLRQDDKKNSRMTKRERQDGKENGRMDTRENGRMDTRENGRMDTRENGRTTPERTAERHQRERQDGTGE